MLHVCTVHDSVIYKTIRNIDDERLLQEDLFKVGEWVVNNRMKLNVGKCNVRLLDLEVITTAIQHDPIIFMGEP
jgi:hypothetical protein